MSTALTNEQVLQFEGYWWWDQHAPLIWPRHIPDPCEDCRDEDMCQ